MRHRLCTLCCLPISRVWLPQSHQDTANCSCLNLIMQWNAPAGIHQANLLMSKRYSQLLCPLRYGLSQQSWRRSGATIWHGGPLIASIHRQGRNVTQDWLSHVITTSKKVNEKYLPNHNHMGIRNMKTIQKNKLMEYSLSGDVQSTIHFPTQSWEAENSKTPSRQTPQ